MGSPKKKVSINLSKADTKFACVYIIMLITVICLLNRKEIFKFKAANKNVNFPTQFSLWSISNGFSDAQLREASLNENMWCVWCVPFDHSSIHKSDILNINKFLITRNNIK